MKRIFSRGNFSQKSTIIGAIAGAAGAVLVNQPNPWLMLAGQIMIAIGGVAVGHDEGGTSK